MEELWKDINLPSTPSLPLHHHHHLPNPQPCNILPETSCNQSSSSNDIFLQDFLAETFKNAPPNYTSSLDPLLNTLQPPISLSLNSGNSQSNNNNQVGGGGGARQVKVQARDGGTDRQQRRMMKNRESAARSRARKQAYTRELEQEIDLLSEENAKLKKEGEKMRLAMLTQVSQKKRLQRSLTAPF